MIFKERAPVDSSNQDGWSQLQTRVEVQLLLPLEVWFLRTSASDQGIL